MESILFKFAHGGARQGQHLVYQLYGRLVAPAWPSLGTAGVDALRTAECGYDLRDVR